jgi:tetratricopeptide (TPR) repeat protein
MSSNTARFDPKLGALPVAILVTVIFFLRPLESRLVAGAWPVESSQKEAGVFGVMGGMRAVVASGFWLRANRVWEERDPGATRAYLKLTVAADSGPRYFWLNGARMMAYDLPEWRLTADTPAAVQRKVREEHAQAALDFLADGLRAHPDDSALLIEMANIRLRVLVDLKGAAQLFRQAAKRADAPYYAARIYAELLTQLGRPDEALAWLKQILPGLPADDPAARREVVVQRIKALEARLAAG